MHKFESFFSSKKNSDLTLGDRRKLTSKEYSQGNQQLSVEIDKASLVQSEL
jgi:hypothetical protein